MTIETLKILIEVCEKQREEAHGNIEKQDDINRDLKVYQDWYYELKEQNK